MLYWNKLFNYLCIFSSIKYTKKKKKQTRHSSQILLGFVWSHWSKALGWRLDIHFFPSDAQESKGGVESKLCVSWKESITDISIFSLSFSCVASNSPVPRISWMVFFWKGLCEQVLQASHCVRCFTSCLILSTSLWDCLIYPCFL